MQEEVQHDLRVLSDSPVSKKLQTVSTQLKDSLKQQKVKMTVFEKKLTKYQHDSSLQLPIQVKWILYSFVFDNENIILSSDIFSLFGIMHIYIYVYQRNRGEMVTQWLISLAYYFAAKLKKINV